jgi:hypothetical protein
LLSKKDYKRIVQLSCFLKGSKRHPHLVVEHANLCQIVAKHSSGYSIIHTVRWQMHTIGIELGSIARVPWCMGVDTANKEAEGLRLVATHELTYSIRSGNGRMRHRAAHSKARYLLEGEHLQLLYRMVFACPPYPISQVGHIMYHTSETTIHRFMVSERTMMLRTQARIEGCSDWNAHCHRAEVVGKQHALFSQTVNVWSLQVFAPIASNLVSS